MRATGTCWTGLAPDKTVSSLSPAHWVVLEGNWANDGRCEVDRDGRVLLVRPRYQRMWTLPGGGVHKQETPEAAAARELREENGVVVNPVEFLLLGLLSNVREGKSDFVAVFSAAIDTEGALTTGPEIEAATCAPVDHLPEETSLATRRRIEEATKRLPIRGMW